ncbi:MAG: Holliday junction resolvase RuvX [Pirellulales bacterium]
MSDATAAEWPSQGRIAGVDFGTVRIGVAVTDPERRFASPWETRTRQSEAQDAAYFERMARDERLVGWVVGLPVYPSGDESPLSTAARRFGAWLARATHLPVVFYDERYSSTAADDYLTEGRLTKKRRQERRDQLAAQILLTSFLEAGQPAADRAP